VTPAASRPGKTSLLLLLFVAAAAFVAGGATLYYFPILPAATPARPTVARPTPLPGETVVALGRIRPAGGLRPVVGPPGDQIAELLVREGDTLSPGQPIARLASRADRQAELDLLEQQTADAEAQKKLAEASGEREIAVAKAKLDEQSRLAPQELEAQKAKLGYLEQQRASAEHRLKSLKDLRRDSPNTVSSQDVEAQDLLLAQTVAEIAAGKALLAKAELAQQTGKQVAEAQLAAARANLERSLREVPLELLAKKRAVAKLQFDRTQVLAPVAGRVIKVHGRVGDPTAPQQPIVELADTAAMQCVAEVYETDILRLRKAGKAKATVRSRALPYDLTGEVTSIGTVIARNAITDIDPTADADRRVFEVVVTLTDKSPAVAAEYLNLQVQVFFEVNPTP
jgi:HlyD family secretion protein